MERLVRDRAVLRLRKIDIADWSSPVAKQYDIRRLPTLLLYDGTELVSKDTQEVLDILGTTP